MFKKKRDLGRVKSPLNLRGGGRDRVPAPASAVVGLAFSRRTFSSAFAVAMAGRASRGCGTRATSARLLPTFVDFPSWVKSMAQNPTGLFAL